MTTTNETQYQPVWCIVANIINVRPFGPEGKEQRHGTKHFAPKAKMYVIDFFWGMAGETITVIGRHRRSQRFITINIRSKWLVNWRVELVYSPYIIRALHDHPWTYYSSNEQPPTNIVEWMSEPLAKARAEEIVQNLRQWNPTAGQQQPFATRSSKHLPTQEPSSTTTLQPAPNEPSQTE